MSRMSIHKNGSHSGAVGTRAIRSWASACVATVTAAILNEPNASARVASSQRESLGTFVGPESIGLDMFLPEVSANNLQPRYVGQPSAGPRLVPNATSHEVPASYHWRYLSKKVLDNRYTDMITSHMLPRQLTLPPHPPAKLNPSLSHSCKLFFTLLAPSFEGSLEGCFSPRVNYHQISNFQVTRRGRFTRCGGTLSRSERKLRWVAIHHGFLSSEKERRRNCSSTNCFRINTCKSVSKQMTLTPFRINTYEKQGGGG